VTEKNKEMICHLTAIATVFNEAIFLKPRSQDFLDSAVLYYDTFFLLIIYA
jgi:hypothetical protein